MAACHRGWVNSGGRAGFFRGEVGFFSLVSGGGRAGPSPGWPTRRGRRLRLSLLGCLAIGLLYGLAETRDWLTDAIRWLLLVGFLGSFTTFSTFGWNSFDLMRHGHLGLALANLAASVALGLLCVWGGYVLGR